jgi:uncharacterized protein YjiS (DUF1127 family)
MHAAILHRYGFAGATARATAALWLRRIASRSHLRELDARLLKDIGFSEWEREKECAKWFWQT